MSEGDVGRHHKFDNFLFWFAVLTGVESPPHVLRGAACNLDIFPNQLSARHTVLFTFFYFPSHDPVLQEGDKRDFT